MEGRLPRHRVGVGGGQPRGPCLAQRDRVGDQQPEGGSEAGGGLWAWWAGRCSCSLQPLGPPRLQSLVPVGRAAAPAGTSSRPLAAGPSSLCVSPVQFWTHSPGECPRPRTHDRHARTHTRGGACMGRNPGSSWFPWGRLPPSACSPGAEWGRRGPWDGPSGDCGVARPPLRSAASPSSSSLSPCPLDF